MRTTSRYDHRLVGVCLRLLEEGIRDPSIVEIACKVQHEPSPPNPITWVDYVGGEVYQGISKRLANLRSILDAEGHQCAPVGLQYYASGMRGRVPEDYEVMSCLPSGGHRRIDADGNPADNRPYGIRFVIDGEEDPIYHAYLNATGSPPSVWLDKVTKRLQKANANGVVPNLKTLALAERFDNKLELSPTKLVQLTRGKK